MDSDDESAVSILKFMKSSEKLPKSARVFEMM